MSIKTSLLHQSFGPRVFLSFFLYFWLIPWSAQAGCVTQGMCLFPSFTLIVDSRPPGSGPIKDQHKGIPQKGKWRAHSPARLPSLFCISLFKAPHTGVNCSTLLYIIHPSWQLIKPELVA
ncbi:unnamed protein product [Rangifer tarandus platyrhynchus]|uniref:Uncharacterized protein n=1 Tax=Rangifer tarandus platyrhynchus TaxID=3082113 RepID=A0AC59ZSP2_RANTA